MDIERKPIPSPETTHIGEFPVIPEVINGVKINFVGVYHSTNFLKKHYNKFCKKTFYDILLS